MESQLVNETLLTLTAEIVAAHVGNNSVSVNDVASLVTQVHGALSRLGIPVEEPAQEKTPVVSVRASIKPQYLVCMECGAKQKTLKRHLQSAHGMTPAQYRTDYGLGNDYPMTAPEYSSQRGEMARAIGLGRKRKGGDEAGSPSEGEAEASNEQPAAAPEPKAARRGRARKPKADQQG